MISHERLKELLHYDPETGVFTRKVKMGAEVSGTVLSSIDNYGYLQVRLDYRLYRAHRLAWIYVRGTWPKGRIDHENTNKTDNRFLNFRDSTAGQNGMNRSKNRNNTSGHKGVVRRETKSGDRFIAQIMVDRRNIYLGMFLTIDEAIAAYAQASVEYHGEFGRTE
jgi:hypothetical protein